MKMNQRGFTLVEGLLLGILAALIAGVGYFVYDSNKKEPQVSAPTVQQTSTKQEAKEEDSWKLVESGKKAFKMRIPDGWKINNDPTQDFIVSSLESSDLVYKKGSPATIISEEQPGSDAPFRFVVSSHTEKYYVETDSEKSEFTLSNGAKGTKTYHLQNTEGEALGPVKGQKSYSYDFEKNGKFFHVGYNILPGDSDNLEIVEKAIKTLEF